MTTRIKNTTAAAAPPEPPARPDGTPYQMEMVYEGGRWRGYADTEDDLAALLIPGYADLRDGGARLQARVSYALGVHVPIQAGVAADGPLSACTKEQCAVLLGTRDQPPAVASWSAPVPLVLVSSFYQPAGPLPRPELAPGAEVIWIDPTTSSSLLASLHAAGWVSLARRVDAGAEAAAKQG